MAEKERLIAMFEEIFEVADEFSISFTDGQMVVDISDGESPKEDEFSMSLIRNVIEAHGWSLAVEDKTRLRVEGVKVIERGHQNSPDVGISSTPSLRVDGSQ